MTPGSLQARIAWRTASTARGRGKLRRHASATRRLGTGAANGRIQGVTFVAWVAATASAVTAAARGHAFNTAFWCAIGFGLLALIPALRLPTAVAHQPDPNTSNPG